jgi:AGZA family xanthine/uracil permease-like MFS transporter
VLSAFGIIHSVLPTGGIYLPWSAAVQGSHVPWHWAAAYLAFAAMVLGFGALDRRAARAEGQAA